MVQMGQHILISTSGTCQHRFRLSLDRYGATFCLCRNEEDLGSSPSAGNDFFLLFTHVALLTLSRRAGVVDSLIYQGMADLEQTSLARHAIARLG